MQKLYVAEGLFAQFEGVPSLVKPKVEYLEREAWKMPVLARQDDLQQLYTDAIVGVYRQLMAAEDDYSSLVQAQPLVRAGKVAAEEMTRILKGFGNEVFHTRSIRAELLDWQPWKRRKGYTLPEGANAVLWRNWDLSKIPIGVSDATEIPVKMAEEGKGKVSEEMVNQLGVPKDAHVVANKRYSVENFDGLNALLWAFWGERPELDVVTGPRDWGLIAGALLGSPLSADEMVRAFKAEGSGEADAEVL